MQTQPLPFNGYSWPFTQHAIAIKPKTLYGLLLCASLFEGKSNPGREITEAMIKSRLLTPNVRRDGGRADAWRDYQQVLAELGLIYSTKVVRTLKLTPAGKMYLSGEIGFSELMSAQALRYQYPNGQKYDLQSRLRQQVGTAETNLIDLYVSENISIKPATLIARVLIELTERKLDATLSVNECLAFLLPLKSNSDWHEAVEAIIESREGSSLPRLNRHAARNIQDWFKFLNMTDFFEANHSEIRLSEYGKQAIAQLKKFSETESQPSSFWHPSDSSKESRIEWFEYFGEIPFNLDVTRPLEKIDLDYEKENYVAGIDEDFDDETAEVGSVSVFLGEVSRETSRMRVKLTGTKMDPNVALANLEKGIMRRITKTLAHEEIVLVLAKHLRDHGAKVYEDSDSFDLLAIWPDSTETLFEVKTITKRSAQQRIRMAVGQLEEYAYRRSIDTGFKPDKVLVINVELPKDTWYIDFLTKHMDISLVSKTKSGYKKHLAKSSKTSSSWGL